jgi:hypothetical protein
MAGKPWFWALLITSAIIGGCATGASGGASVSSPRMYPDCPPNSYGPNAHCYGGGPV